MQEILTFFSEATLTLSVREVFILMVYLSVCILLGKNKIGLLGTYAFLLYWGFLANKAQMVSALGKAKLSLYLYPALALFLVVIAFIGFLRPED